MTPLLCLGETVRDDAHGEEFHRQPPVLRLLHRSIGARVERGRVRLLARTGTGQKVRCSRPHYRLVEWNGIAAHAACMYMLHILRSTRHLVVVLYFIVDYPISVERQ